MRLAATVSDHFPKSLFWMLKLAVEAVISELVFVLFSLFCGKIQGNLPSSA